jgi:hypothetical protein
MPPRREASRAAINHRERPRDRHPLLLAARHVHGGIVRGEAMRIADIVGG